MFSVVVPIYNHVAYVRDAVFSALRSPLVQEVLLLDDGSKDGSDAAVGNLAREEERVVDLTPAGGGNRGAHNRLNELVAAAHCEWVAVLNSDDVLVAGRFEAIVQEPRFDRSDFVFGNLLLMDANGTLSGAKRGPFDTGTPFPREFDIAGMVDRGELLDLLSHQNYLGTTSNMVFRKTLHAAIGGFRAYRYVHDWDFALRAMALGSPLYLQRYITAYRIHRHNTISESRDRVNIESADVFARFCADFPEIAARKQFQTGLADNVNVAPVRGNAAVA